MGQERVENCRITSTSFGYEDHGILTAMVFVEGHGWGCGFGGYAFDQWDEQTNARIPGNGFGLRWMTAVMKAVGIESWEKLPGTFCRVKTTGFGGGITAVGHLLKDEWFDPKSLRP